MFAMFSNFSGRLTVQRAAHSGCGLCHGGRGQADAPTNQENIGTMVLGYGRVVCMWVVRKFLTVFAYLTPFQVQ